MTTIPSNIKEFAKRRGIMPLVNKVNRWANDIGKRIYGGTVIGKYYNYTLVLDVSGYQSSDVYINLANKTIEANNIKVKTLAEFKKAMGYE